MFAGVAQLVAQHTFNVTVVGFESHRPHHKTSSAWRHEPLANVDKTVWGAENADLTSQL